MKKLFLYVWKLGKYLVLLAIILTAVGWYRAPSEPADPQLQLVDLNGQLLDLQKMSKEKPLLVYFWGSWCGVCAITSPSVQNLVDDGYNVVTVAIQSGTPLQIKQYLAKKGYTFTTINAPQGKIFKEWNGSVTPSFIILDKGKMKQGLSGIQATWSLKLRLWLNQFL